MCVAVCACACVCMCLCEEGGGIVCSIRGAGLGALRTLTHSLTP